MKKRVYNKKIYLSFIVFLAIFLLSGCSNKNATDKIQPATSIQKPVQSSAEIEKTATSEQGVINSEKQTNESQAPAINSESCGADYYLNVDGNCVHRPSDNPSGASAKCRDGSYSYSQHRQGTCSGHGGVAQWL